MADSKTKTAGFVVTAVVVTVGVTTFYGHGKICFPDYLCILACCFERPVPTVPVAIVPEANVADATALEEQIIPHDKHFEQLPLIFTILILQGIHVPKETFVIFVGDHVGNRWISQASNDQLLLLSSPLALVGSLRVVADIRIELFQLEFIKSVNAARFGL